MITSENKFPAFHMKTDPYKHQQDDFIRTRDLEYWGWFWEMGTGKSKIVVDTAGYLFLKGEIDGVLIFSDKGAYLNWETDELPKHTMEEIPWRCAHWSSSMKRKEEAAANELLVAEDDTLDFMCMNIESLVSDRAFKFAKEFVKNHYCMVVVDEATSIKNPKADRTKSAIELGKLAAYRRILTGTPITQSPLDLYGMCQFLKEGILGFNAFVPFRSQYAEMITISLGSRSFQKISGYRNLNELSDKIAKFSSRVLKVDCLDLPDKIYERIYVEQTPEQRRYYQELKEIALIQFEQGLLTSTSALTTLNKLHQINCGHVKLDDETVVDIPNNRINALMDLLELLGEKVIIWCNFQRDVELILLAIKSRFVDKGIYGVDYYGKTSEADRASSLAKFKHDHNCWWFVGTAATGGKGLTLVGARYVAYYSCGYRLDFRLQSEDRNHRIGQTKNVTYFDFICPDTVDMRILKSHETKQDLSRTVLRDFRELV
jgi:SNF2 family DNA or RNA helicase